MDGVEERHPKNLTRAPPGIIRGREISCPNIVVSLEDDVAQFVTFGVRKVKLLALLCLHLISVVSLQLHGSVRKMSSHVRMDTASAACGTVMAITTVATIAMSSVVSRVALQIPPC